MIEKVSACITNFYLRYLPEKENEREIIQYGTEHIISNIVNITIVLIIGKCFSSIGDSIVFFVCFAGLRRYTGGYHANTYVKCDFILGMNVILVMLIKKYLKGCINNIFAIVSLFAIICFLVACFAPIDNENRVLNMNEKRIAKVKAIAICIAYAIICCILFYFKKMDSLLIIILSVASVIISIIAAQMLNLRK